MQKVIDLSRYFHIGADAASDVGSTGLDEIVGSIAEELVEIASLLALGKFAPLQRGIDPRVESRASAA